MSHRRHRPKAETNLARKVAQLERVLAPIERRLQRHEAHCSRCHSDPETPCAWVQELLEPWMPALQAYLAAVEELRALQRSSSAA